MREKKRKYSSNTQNLIINPDNRRPLPQSFAKEQHHGAVIFLQALKTKDSLGVGEFPDLIPMIEWFNEINFDVLQLLPLNDSGLDPSPYNAISAFALNPIFLRLPIPQNENQKIIIRKLKTLNECKLVKYRKVYLLKDDYFTDIFANIKDKKQLYEELDQFSQESPWVKMYAQYKLLREQNDWKPVPPNTQIKKLSASQRERFYYHLWVQFLCRQQMSQVKSYADSLQVLIKGDLPILLSPDSADVWSAPSNFNLEFSAGAPPDAYAKNGQYWGFPTFNWIEHKEDLLQWCHSRLKNFEKYYHAYRIDHVVGLFRLWTILRGKPATEGKFVPSTKKAWLSQGKSILKKFLTFSKMLPIAEDLGSVPIEVKECLQTLGIPGTKVLIWENDMNGFPIPLDEYPPISMSTLSTHDTDLFKHWWNENPKTSETWAKSMGLPYKKNISKALLKQVLRLCHGSSSVFHINLLQEYLCIIPNYTWDDQRKDRINIPGTVGDKNWCYRYRPSVEQMISCRQLKELMRELAISER
ncbi:MAG: 4-alpha-glucanotransferase [Chlamydiota bacterium]|nr:4-alpha-glucanotransferase [Chlamydiota bacterium]